MTEDRNHTISLACRIENKKEINKQNKNKLMDTHNRRVVTTGEEAGGGKGKGDQTDGYKRNPGFLWRVLGSISRYQITMCA